MLNMKRGEEIILCAYVCAKGLPFSLIPYNHPCLIMRKCKELSGLPQAAEPVIGCGEIRTPRFASKAPALPVARGFL